jgi:hypothetical protein
MMAYMLFITLSDYLKLSTKSSIKINNWQNDNVKLITILYCNDK